MQMPCEIEAMKLCTVKGLGLDYMGCGLDSFKAVFQRLCSICRKKQQLSSGSTKPKFPGPKAPFLGSSEASQEAITH